jgi:hypothetical protein
MRADGLWVGQRENADRASIIAGDKEMVVQHIREIVATHKARMFVYDRDGQLQPQRTYPRRLRRVDQPVGED